MRSRKSKRVTVRLSEGHLMILEELKRALRVSDVSTCVRFCVEFTGAFLSLERREYSNKVVDALAEAVRKVKLAGRETSDRESDKAIN